MRYQNILAVALCMFSFVAADNCNDRFNPEEIREINDIVSEYNVSSCIAGNIFDYMKETQKFSNGDGLTEKECDTGCRNEAAAKLNGLDPSMADDFITICYNQCYLSNLKPNNDNEPEDKTNDFEKRGDTCDPISEANVAVVNQNVKYGFKQYKDKGKKKTALSHVNGCGPHKSVMGISNETLKNNSLLLTNTFLPACNMHDICYTCKKGKSICDTRFKDAMISICNMAFSGKANKSKNKSCKTQAEVFYQAVNIFGTKAYNGHPVNTDYNCAACGVKVIKNDLVKTPFYKA